MCMLLNLLSYASLLKKEGTNKSTKSKGGIECSIHRPVGGWVCYTGAGDIDRPIAFASRKISTAERNYTTT
jgi:hypothetical protein